MARVLLTYEFGSGLGHVNRLISVAKRLKSTDSLVFALPHAPSMGSLISDAFGQRATLRPGVEWLAPADPSARMVPTHTLADVIRLFRFNDASTLGPAVDRWRALIDEIKPDLIIADFAPTLRLAIGDMIPTIIVGNGYTVPPPGRMLPPIRPWQSEVPAASRANEEHLLRVINQIRAQNDSSSVDYVADLFSGQSTFICTMPEFDPYHSYRTKPVSWPFNVPSISPGPPAMERLGPTIFTYLPSAHPLTESMIEALNRLKHKTYLYIAGTNSRDLAKRCARHIGILTKPADFADILPKVRLLIHHAGLGTAYAGLAAGTPQLVLPLNLEHLITARGLTAAGVALGFNRPPPDPSTLFEAIETLLTEPAWMARASARAAELAQSKDPDPLAEVISAYKEITDHNRAH